MNDILLYQKLLSRNKQLSVYSSAMQSNQRYFRFFDTEGSLNNIMKRILHHEDESEERKHYHTMIERARFLYDCKTVSPTIKPRVYKSVEYNTFRVRSTDLIFYERIAPRKMGLMISDIFICIYDEDVANGHEDDIFNKFFNQDYKKHDNNVSYQRLREEIEEFVIDYGTDFGVINNE